jgi:hypothetical protein
VDPTANLPVKLQSLDKPKLRKLWQNSFNRPPSPRLRCELMAPILAFRIQELAHGGLTLETKAKLHEIRFCLSSKAQNDARQRFKSGTKLVRESKGKVHEVTITADGFEYQGETYKTLSPIACRITGTHWSGPAFFGTKKRQEEPMRPNSRCAIYTRKSSEEGLEQSFNSLHAQREACEA